jgi:hypothetical protein
MDQRRDEREQRDEQRERKSSEEHPGAEGEKLRVPADVRQEPGQAPLGNGGTNEPAAFPDHN